MSFQKSCFGQPWIVDLVTKYRKQEKQLKCVPALVLAFVNLTEKQAEDPWCPAAAIHISDAQYYIKALVSEKAKQEMEQEEEHYVLSDIKHKVIILRNFSIIFRAEVELKDCEFYILIQQFRILPMETNIITTPSCTKDCAIQKKTEELWRSHAAEIELKAMRCSDLTLTQLLNAVEEEKLSALRSVAEACLGIRDTAKPSTSEDTCTLQYTNECQSWWQTSQRLQKRDGNSFTVPVTCLIIPPDQNEALENIKEWKNNAVYTTPGMSETMLEDEEGNHDLSSVEEMHTCPSFIYNETPIDENKDCQAANPWNTFQSVSFSAASSSGEMPVLCQSSHESWVVSDGRDEDNEEMPHPDSSTPDDLCFPVQKSEDNHLNSLVAEEKEVNMSMSPPLFPDSSVNLNSSCSGKPNGEPDESTVHVDQTPLLDSEDGPCSIVNGLEISESPLYKDYGINPVSSSVNDAVHHASSSSPQSLSLLQTPPCKSTVTDGSAQVSPEADELNIYTSESDILESEEEQRHGDCLYRFQQPKVSKIRHRSFSESCEDSFKTVEEQGIMKRRGGRDPVGETKHFLRSRCNTEKPTYRKKTALEFKEVNRIQKSRERLHLNAVTQDSPAPKRRQGAISLKRPVQTLNSAKVQSSVNNNGDEGPSKPASQVHSDGTPFQYQYGTPSSCLCRKIQSVRMPKRLLKWALQVILEHGSQEKS